MAYILFATSQKKRDQSPPLFPEYPVKWVTVRSSPASLWQSQQRSGNVFIFGN